MRLPSFLLLLPLAGAFAAEATDSTPATRLLEDLRAANLARADLARESAAWNAEKERLSAVLDGVRADAKRLDQDAMAAEGVRDRAQADVTRIGSGSDLDAVRAGLAAQAELIAARLATLRSELPPGAVAMIKPGLTGEAAFDEAVRALDATERAAGTVAIEIVPETIDGKPEAVRMLRVSGALAWWLALDSRRGGTVAITGGVPTCTPVTDPEAVEAIARAVLMVEGRIPAEIVRLPLAARAGAAP